MFEEGKLKENEAGGYDVVEDPAESEYIKSQVAASKRRPIGESQIDRINAELERLEQNPDQNS